MIFLLLTSFFFLTNNTTSCSYEPFIGTRIASAFLLSRKPFSAHFLPPNKTVWSPSVKKHTAGTQAPCEKNIPQSIRRAIEAGLLRHFFHIRSTQFRIEASEKNSPTFRLDMQQKTVFCNPDKATKLGPVKFDRTLDQALKKIHKKV